MLWLHPTFMVTSSRKSAPIDSLWVLTLACRDAAAALVGSLGVIPSINAGDDFVMGEPYVFSGMRSIYLLSELIQGPWLGS